MIVPFFHSVELPGRAAFPHCRRFGGVRRILRITHCNIVHSRESVECSEEEEARRVPVASMITLDPSDLQIDFTYSTSKEFAMNAAALPSLQQILS